MSSIHFLSDSLNKLENVWTIRVYYLFLLSVLWIEYASCSARIRQVEKDILDKYLGSNYDTRIRPNGHHESGKICGEEASDDGNVEDAPCRVDINMLVRSISRIDDIKMEYSTQLTFREHWHDDRLCYEEDLRRNNLSKIVKFLVLTEPERVWLPDLFFKNEKKGHFHKIIMPNVLLRVYPNGAITYSVRISLVLICNMDLRYFPLDVQSCNITIASYGYQNKDLWLDWKPGKPSEIISLPPKPYLPRFSLASHHTERCDSTTNTGNYSCINLIFKFKREFSYYLFLIYVPCCMLVIVSWVSFWIDPNSAAARVLLGVTSLLTMSRQISSINATLPPVNYIKAVDVWTECCLIFVFSALIEFAIVNYVSRADAARAGHKRKRPAMNGARKKYDDSKDSGIESSDVEAGRNKSNKDQFNASMPQTVKKTDKPKSVTQRLYAWWVSRFTTRSKKIDVTSRVCFPLLFVIFNIFYWAKYMFRAELRAAIS